MTIEQLRALLAQKMGALGPVKDKAMAEQASVGDVTALEAAMAEIEGIEKKIDLAVKAEDAVARAARAVPPGPAPTPEQQRGTVPAAPEIKVTTDQKLSLVAAGIIKAGKGGDALKVLADEGYQGFVDELKTAAARSGKSINTVNSGDGGILVPTTLEGSIIPFLRNQSTFLNANPRRVQLVNGAFKQPRGATGATASYVGEGARKPVTQPTFDAIDMKAKKLAGIVPLTNEAKAWTVGNIEQYIRDDLSSAIAVTLDLNAYLGTGTGDAPLGILNKAGVQTLSFAFANPAAPTLAELDAFANQMILKLTTANILTTGGWCWLMSYRTALFLAGLRVGGVDGDLAFPEMEFGRPGGQRWKGFPVIVSNQFPTNGGTGTDETLIGLVDFTHVLFGDTGGGIEMKTSDQATIKTGTATDGSDILYLWQQNMFAILAETQHDFGLRYAKAVVKQTNIRF